MENFDPAEYAQHDQKIRLKLFLEYFYSNIKPFHTKLLSFSSRENEILGWPPDKNTL